MPRIDEKGAHWAFDKRIPIATLLMFAVQIAMLGYWGGGVETRLNELEKDMSHSAKIVERLAAIEAHQENVYRRLSRIDNKLDRVE